MDSFSSLDESMLLRLILGGVVGLVLLHALLGSGFAAWKGRNPLGWGLLSALFLLPTLVILMFLPPLCKTCKHTISSKEWLAKQCGRCRNKSEKKFTCGCGHQFVVRASQAGGTVTCESCSEEITLPGLRKLKALSG